MAKEEEIIEDRGDAYLPDDDESDGGYEEVEEELEDEEDEEESDAEEDEESSEEDEDDSEDEESDDEEDEDEDDGEDDEDSKGNRIPRSRLNQVLRQRDAEREARAADRTRIEWLEKQLESMITTKTPPKQEEPEPEPYDFDAAEEAYIEHILQGETKEAAKLRREINKAHDEEYKRQVTSARQSAAEEAVSKAEASRDEERFQMLLEDIVDEYDFLDDTSKAYNEKAVRMANNLMASYMQEGRNKTTSLKMAVEDIIPLFEKKKKGEEKPTTPKRTVEARRKAAKASNQQPPSSKSKGGKEVRNFDAKDIERMSEKQYASLTAREKARLRGDVV